MDMEIRQSVFSVFTRRFNRLGKLAVKLELEVPTFEIIGEVTHPVPALSDSDRERIKAKDPTYPVDVYNVTRITGDAPQVPGFRFVGKIEPSEVAGINYVSAIPNLDLNLTPFAKIAIECEHCQTRRSRKAAYLVESTDTGSIFRVGKSCLQDFTGHASPESCANYLEMIAAFGEFEGDDFLTAKRVPAWNLEGFVQMVVACVQEFGWANASSPLPTRSLVISALEEDGPFSRSLPANERSEVPEITDAHKATAAAAIKWARSLSPDPVINTNDYLRNLRLSVEPEFVIAKRAGLLASILGAFTRARADEIKKTERAADKEAAAPIPEFDGRVRIEGTIVAARWKSTDFGEVLKITIRHADGWKVYGSCPRAISGEKDSTGLIGVKIEFDARVEASKDDPKFGFYSRPTKVVVEHPPTTGE